MHAFNLFYTNYCYYRYATCSFRVSKYLQLAVILFSCDVLTVKLYKPKLLPILLITMQWCVQIYSAICIYYGYDSYQHNTYADIRFILLDIVTFGIVSYGLYCIKDFWSYISREPGT